MSPTKAKKGSFNKDIIKKMVERYGSPLFILSETELKNKYHILRSALTKSYPSSSVAYSFKTNYLPGVCKILKKEGALAEVVSGFEYALAKKLGYSGQELIFNGPAKDNASLEKALVGGSIVNVDNSEELQRIMQIAERHGQVFKIGIRVN